MNAEEVVKERTAEYGNFQTLANLSRALTDTTLKHYENTHNTCTDTPARLPNFMVESLHMINHKIARMANGNAYKEDNWLDIAGYAQLVVNILEASKTAQQEKE